MAECQRIDAFELGAGEDSWDCFGLQRDQTVSFEGNQPDAGALELWPSDVMSQLFGKDPDAGKDWGQKEKGTTEDEMVGWCHWLNGHEYEQAPGFSKGLESLACCMQSMVLQRVGLELAIEQQHFPSLALSRM